MHPFHSEYCKILQNIHKTIIFLWNNINKIVFAKCLQQLDCKYFAMNPRGILHNRCNKFAKSLQNWMVLQKWCNNFAKLLQLFYKGYCKMFAIGLHNLCKILAFISNLTKPVFAWFCKQFAMLLGERHQKVCKKSAKDRMVNFPEKSWPCLKKHSAPKSWIRVCE